MSNDTPIISATFYDEPVDQYLHVRRSWERQVEGCQSGVIFLRSRPGEWTSQSHDWTMKYTLAGSCRFAVEGIWCRVWPGFACVIPAPLQYRASLNNGTALSIFGAGLCALPTAASQGIAGEGVFGVFPLSGAEQQEVLRLRKALRRETRRAGRHSLGIEVTLESRLPLPTSYLDVLARVRNWSTSRLRRRTARRLLLARHYITSRHARPNVCVRAADVASMTRSHFSRQFSALFGQSPRALLVDHRQAVAMSLLRSGQFTVAQVADRLGYRYSSSLAHLFQRGQLVNPRAALNRPVSAA